MNQKEIGSIFEIDLAAKLLSMGYQISKPLVDSYSYDLIVDNTENLFKVQVKSIANVCVRKKDKSKFFKVPLKKGSKIKTSYQPNEVDIFAIYIVSLSCWYFLPYSILESKRAVTLFPHVENSKEKYRKYLNFFDVFKKSKDDNIVQ